jgi:hypothetical protein
MGGGNAQKSKMARERNAEKNKAGKGNNYQHGFSLQIPIHPSLRFPPSLTLTLSIRFPFPFAGSQLEANKKAMNIQVRCVALRGGIHSI